MIKHRKPRKSPITIDDARLLVKSKGGKCLSEHYIRASSKLHIKCSNGHTWGASYTQIRIGQWCPYCKNKYTHEEQCRHVLSSLTGENFPKDNKVLKNGMHLDGYCRKLKLAFEYDGEQHFKFVKFWHKTLDIFQKQQARDLIKNHLCSSLNIKLIRIPYTETANLEDYIKNILVNEKIPVAKTQVDWSKYWKKHNNVLEECKSYAHKNGGTLYSDVYMSSRTKMMWECSKGHTWMSSWNSIKSGHWCSKCNSISRRYTISQMQDIAKSQSGKCLSLDYENKRSKLRWECSKGHVWQARPQDILSGRWCPKCAGRNRNIQNLQKFAEHKGGKCLSRTYASSSEKYLWECKNHHQWEATARSIFSGSWCWKCHTNSRKNNIESLQKLAKSRGGECLSTVYKDNKTHLQWKCSNDHIWEATSGNVVRGSWCPKCKNSNCNLGLERKTHGKVTDKKRTGSTQS